MRSVPVFVVERQGEPCVYYRLLSERLLKERKGDIYIGKYVEIRLPFNDRAGAAPYGLLREKLCCRKSLFKGYGALILPGIARYVHIFRRALRRTGAESVETERILIGLPRIVVVLSACVQLAVYEIPVIPLLLLVPAERNASSEVLNGY